MPRVSEAWTLSDGHAGNVRQAQALAVAMGIPARDWTLHAHAPWRWLSPRRLPGATQAFGAEFARAASQPPAVAIGCGRQAALATRLLRDRGARAVQILDPRIATRHWDVVVAPEHDGLRGGNVVTLLGSLHPVSDAWLGAARAAFAEFARLPQPRTAVLVGGPTTHLRIAPREFDAWLAIVRDVVEREGGSVLATASRRTPQAFVEAMRRRFDGLPGLVWAGSVDGRNPYAALLGWADRVVCTADSVNMLSEAAATHVPVHVAGLDRVQGRPGRFAAALRERGRGRAIDASLQAFACEALRETPRIAAAVRERFGLGQSGRSAT